MIPVLCPYTDLRPETRAALPGEVVYLDVSRDEDYYWALQGFWHRAEGVIVVEHDIVVALDTIASLRACERDWCGSPYLVGRNIDSWLGCVKFGPALMRRHPDAVNSMERYEWNSLDGQLLPYLRLRGEDCHRHWPAVRHLNECADESLVLANCPTCGAAIRFAEVQVGPNTVRCRQGHWVNFYPKG